MRDGRDTSHLEASRVRRGCSMQTESNEPRGIRATATRRWADEEEVSCGAITVKMDRNKSLMCVSLFLFCPVQGGTSGPFQDANRRGTEYSLRIPPGPTLFARKQGNLLAWLQVRQRPPVSSWAGRPPPDAGVPVFSGPVVTRGTEADKSTAMAGARRAVPFGNRCRATAVGTESTSLRETPGRHAHESCPLMDLAGRR